MESFSNPSVLDYMRLALAEAKGAFDNDEVPVGAIIVRGGEILVRQSNHMHSTKNPLHHAEFLAIQEALLKTRENNLRDCTLFVTLEPCAMCAGAIALCGMKAVYFGAYDTKMGQLDNNGQLLRDDPCSVYGGILEEECSQLLKDFFKQKR